MKRIMKNSAVQSLLASLACIIVGLLIGYIVLLFINPAGAWDAILTVIKNFFYYPSKPAALKYFGSTLVKTVPLMLCGLSVLFAYKVGLFNIGAAGQYVAGAGAALYLALALNQPWYVCVIGAMLAGAMLGAISGALKSYCNVNEVISCIMLNWISLYVVNMILTTVKETTSPYTVTISSTNPAALIPSLGLGKLFSNNQYVTIALPIALLVSILIWVVLEKTKFGYELRATGNNKNAAKYCGMNEKRNIILTMVIAGALAGLGAALLFLTGFEQWQCSQSSVPGMGFNGIAAATVIVKAMNTAESPDNVSSTIQYINAKKAFLVNIGSFEFNWFMLLAVIALVCSFITLYRTRFGLRLMACGEHPQAADSVGINVYKMRWAGVLISGLLGGLGGIVYITAGVSEWKFENGVAGFGFLSLAVMIFGQWKPIRIALAALLFGMFRALSNVYTGFDFLTALNMPSTVYNMLPYIISLIVLAFTSKKSRAPKAEGIPYDKGSR